MALLIIQNTLFCACVQTEFYFSTSVELFKVFVLPWQRCSVFYQNRLIDVALVLTYAIFVKNIYDTTHILSVIACWCIEVLIIHWNQTLLGISVLTGLMSINQTSLEVLEGVYI